jgi:hypothetical protein
VACGASRRGGWEARRNVIGNAAADALRLVPVRSVARHAIAGGQCVIVVPMALRAGRGCMCADQRKARVVVIERRGVPAQRGMAIRAVG